jgi:hypothetical protein
LPLGHVRVPLLRHDRRARAVAVRQVDEAEVLAHPQHDLLGQARDVHHADRGEGRELEREVAVAHGVQAVAAHVLEAQGARHRLAVQRVARAGQCGRTQRQPVHAPAHVGQSLGIAREHLHVGQQVVREAHRLSDLQVREAGHHGVGVAGRELHEAALHLRQQRHQRVDLAAQPQPHIGGHLVVARAPGVQPLAGIPHELRQARLDVQVHVLELELPREAARLDLGRDLGHAALDLGEVLRGDDGLGSQHARVGQAARDVGAPQALVEVDAGRVALHQLAHRLAEQRRPGLGLVVEGVEAHGAGGQAGSAGELRIIPLRAHR